MEYQPGETQGAWVGRLVDAAGPSLNQVAVRAKVSRETLSKIVNDKASLTEAMAVRLAPTLGVTPEKLLLPREAEVESRRGLERRLELVEGQAAWLRRKLIEVLTEMNLELDDDGIEGAPAVVRSQPSRPRRKRA
jgi:plasmid maintenance system antidote protein VapI